MGGKVTPCSGGVPRGATVGRRQLRCVGLTEYRLEALARLSGVSARNIRAYRERGLLDPPRRQGRAALYDDVHLAQLATIDHLLRKGFNSAHIAEFFASVRDGTNLAETLGLRRAVFISPHGVNGDGSGSAAGRRAGGTAVPELDPGAEEVRQLRERGLADVVDGVVVIADPAIGRVLAGTRDKLVYLRAVLSVFDATHRAIDRLAAELAEGLHDCVAARSATGCGVRDADVHELDRMMRDYGDLADTMLTHRLSREIARRLDAVAAGYAAAVDRQPEPRIC